MTSPPVDAVVVDASAVVELVLAAGEVGRWVEGTLEGSQLWAPSVMPFEVANALRRNVVTMVLDEGAMRVALAELLALPVILVPFAHLATRAWELRANLTMYDASYVALAELLDAPLVTLDARIARAPGVRCEVRAFAPPGEDQTVSSEPDSTDA